MRNDVIIAKLIRLTDTILNYCHDVSHDGFSANSMLIEACVFNLSQMGELVRHLDADFRASHPGIPWHQLYGLRNRIVHDYEGVNPDLVWEIVTEDLPSLRDSLEKIQEID